MLLPLTLELQISVQNISPYFIRSYFNISLVIKQQEVQQAPGVSTQSTELAFAALSCIALNISERVIFDSLKYCQSISYQLFQHLQRKHRLENFEFPIRKSDVFATFNCCIFLVEELEVQAEYRCVQLSSDVFLRIYTSGDINQ
ncbi:Hypothetical_protein [Hexamita inflata]|uniref:Hypothetical_protein n=1 Tax=Hexamita inflata TaxID=28002 RepID=A0AA86THV2_9EUKA|nr:Hypothetical protein HINF_LOCUS1218 [Hexamita inflata]